MAIRIYTKTGDDGETGLIGGARTSKDAPRIEACGAVDELNAALGFARALAPSFSADAMLNTAQNTLFRVGADIAAPAELNSLRVMDHDVSVVEAAIDAYEARLAPLRRFILPGGSPTAAALHLARTICRRAERRTVSLRQTLRDGGEELNPEVIRYLNRLSDLLFVLARVANAEVDVPDVPWIP